jgi:hypothetical protein
MRYTCSYCELPATQVGAGQDGDFYCEGHAYLAPGATVPVTA